MYYVKLIIPLFLVYLALTSNLEVSNLVVGLLATTGITLLVRPRLQAETDWRRLPAAMLAFGRYLLTLLWDLIRSGVQVARLVLTPGVSLQQGIIAIPAETSSSLGRALSAHAITVTPGEMVVEMDEEGTMYTHCLDATAAETAVAHQRQRRAMLERILGAKDDG